MTRQINLTQEDLAVILRSFLKLKDATITFNIEQDDKTNNYRVSASIIGSSEEMVIQNEEQQK